MDPGTLILIIAASAWITGATFKEVVGDGVAAYRGEQAPSQERWLKNHERKMEKLRQKGELGAVAAPSAAPMYAKRVVDNAVQRWADRSAQKTREQREFLHAHGDAIAKDKVQRRYDWHRRRQDAVSLLGGIWDETVERGKERQARKRNERLGPMALDEEPVPGGVRSREDKPGGEVAFDPASRAFGGVAVHISDEALQQLREEAERQREHEREMADRQRVYEPRFVSTGSRPRAGRRHSEGGGNGSQTTPPAPDEPGTVRAYAERIYPTCPALESAAEEHSPPREHDERPALEAAAVEDDDIVDAEVVDEASSSLAPVIPISQNKENSMATIEGGIEGAVAKLDNYADWFEQAKGSLAATRDAFEAARWNGEPLDRIQSAHNDLLRAIENIQAASNSISAGGYGVRDALEAHSQVGDDQSVRAQ